MRQGSSQRSCVLRVSCERPLQHREDFHKRTAFIMHGQRGAEDVQSRIQQRECTESRRLGLVKIVASKKPHDPLTPLSSLRLQGFLEDLERNTATKDFPREQSSNPSSACEDASLRRGIAIVLAALELMRRDCVKLYQVVHQRGQNGLHGNSKGRSSQRAGDDGWLRQVYVIRDSLHLSSLCELNGEVRFFTFPDLHVLARDDPRPHATTDGFVAGSLWLFEVIDFVSLPKLLCGGRDAYDPGNFFRCF
mmetsp:Transcript_14544/g.54953  ORF Transcript_14544/g.54953 Transcript_14544/m.54953 type:complete len:249 (+) Transcript_14544:2015-2761(+)|eukprot:scaffold1435_cov267-Pinguiococcus_pyrenoidosus.AAC.54